jgi:bifunctional ADP-heptose synthase (sugar kinase/adenylyltransferase)
MQEFIYKNDEVHPFSGEQTFKFVLNDDKANLEKDPYTYPSFQKNNTEDMIGKEIVFTEKDFDVTHECYIRYLRMAWDKDYGIVVKPDYIIF